MAQSNVNMSKLKRSFQMLAAKIPQRTICGIMVDSNIQRENILPSEKAFAYKMKLDAMNRQGKRTDLTFSQNGKK